MSPGSVVDYDRAAAPYAAHRQTHPRVLEELRSRVRVRPGAALLEVGCGTGNYIAACLPAGGARLCGLDPSAGMLARARTRPEPVAWTQGLAERLPFAPARFDLVFSVDVIHHVAGKAAFYRQAARVLRPGGQLCTVTDSPEIIRQREILSGYFPETVPLELARYPRPAQLLAWMDQAGFVGFESVLVEQPFQVADARPFRERAYSSLHLISREAWWAGLARLERDLVRGPVPGVSRYLCLWGRKPAARRRPGWKPGDGI